MKSVVYSTLLSIVLIASPARSMDIEKKHIMVPLEGFLFQVDTSAALGEMGTSGALSAAWTGGLSSLWRSASSKGPDQKAIATRLFTLLGEIEYEKTITQQPQQPLPEVYWRGIKAPPIMAYEWLKGSKTCTELLELVLPHIQTRAGRLEKVSLERLATIIFDPAKNASMLKPNQEAVELLTLLQDNGHILHVVDNWNEQAFDALKTQHQEPFALINGCMHVSGQARFVKSAQSSEFHDKFFSIHSHIAPEDCTFIETEEQHAAPLVGKPYQHILCKDADIKKLRCALQKIGLLEN